MKRWGEFVYRHRRMVLLASVACFVASGVAIVTGGQFKNSENYDVESIHAADLMTQQLPKASGTTFALILGSPARLYTDAIFQSQVHDALADLERDSRVSHIDTPYNSPAETARTLVSTDKRSIVALVRLTIDFNTARQQFGDIRAQASSSALTITAAGDPAIAYDFDSSLAKDLQRSEAISLPLALLLLLIVFGTGVAALLCLGVGVFAVAGGVGATLLLTHTMDVST